MLIVLIPAAGLVAAWAAWSLFDIVQAVPRCNADLGAF